MKTNGHGSKTSGFVIEERPEGPTLVVTGQWSPDVEAALVGSAIDGLELNYARGYREQDLEFLVDDFHIARLLILDRRLADLSPLSRLSALRELRVETAPTATVPLDALPRLATLAADWVQVEGTLPEAEALRCLIASGYDREDLRALEVLDSIEMLELRQAGLLDSLTGIEHLPALSALRIFGAERLGDLVPIRTAADSLVELDLEDCPAVGSLADVEGLVALRFLGFSDCGDIASLRPLAALKHLEVLHAWGTTRIVDADLSPLSHLPHLSEVRMRDRRGYKPRVSELVAA